MFLARTIRWTLLAAALLVGLIDQARAEPGDDQFAVASGHYAASRWKLAADEFATLLSKFPDHPSRSQGEFYLGESLVQLKQFKEAATHFQAATTTDPQGKYARQALFRAGEASLFADDNATAEKLLQQFLQKHPSDPLNGYTLNYLGELALVGNNPAQAAKYYQQSLTQFPLTEIEGDVRLGLAQAELRQKNYAAAEEQLKTLLDKKQLELPSLYWLGQVQKAQQQWELAAQTLQSAIDKNPRHPSVEAIRFQAADAQLRGKQYEAALKTLLTKDPSQDQDRPAEQRYLIALARQGLDQHAQAAKLLLGLDSTIQSDLRHSTLLALATSQAALDQHISAIQTLQPLLEQAADESTDVQQRAQMHALLALSNAKLQHWDAAKVALASLRGVAPDSLLTMETIEHLAAVATKSGDPIWAGELHTLLADEKNPPEVIAKGLAGLAGTQLTGDEAAKAAVTFEKLLEKFPEDARVAEAALARGEALEKLQKPDAALAMYGLVHGKHRGDKYAPLALFRAAQVHGQLQQDTDAIQLYTRVVNDHPKSAQVDSALYGWAWSAKRLQRQDEATAKFQQLHQEYKQSRYWPDATYRLAQSAYQAKQYDQGRTLLDQLLKAADPATSDKASQERFSASTIQHALYLRGQIATAATRYADAEADFMRITKEYPDCELARPAKYLLADAIYRQDRFADAAAQLDGLIASTSKSKERWAPMVVLRRAQTHAQQKQWAEARKLAEQVSQDFPEFEQQYEVDYLLGRCLSNEANFVDARSAYEKVIRSKAGGKTETAAMAQWMIGESHFHQEDYATAIREYLKVEILYAYPRWQAAALMQAGKCQELLNQPQEAVALYDRMLKLYSHPDFQAEAKQRSDAIRARTAAETKDGTVR
ncbi:MAG: tetratricopeptide repeat protein [Planctomycetota bacterium]|nr:tetratricopeptide repeat protein [Planctomycetota bacterium]